MRLGRFRLTMSDSESTHGPRRSQRERKQVIHFTSGSSIPPSFSCALPPHVIHSTRTGPSQKRKRDRLDSDHEEAEHTERHLSSDPDDLPSPDEHEHTDYRAQILRGKGAGPPKKRGKPKAPRRTRVIKTGDAKETSARKSKKPQANGDASNVNKVPQDFKINTDNPLFSAC